MRQAVTGTALVTRFALRRDRIRIAVWIVGHRWPVVVDRVASVKGLYPTQADLRPGRRGLGSNAAAIAFNGPALALDTVGGQVAFQVGAFGLVIVALMSVLMVGRLTRGEEEAGRLGAVAFAADRSARARRRGDAHRRRQ